MKILVLMMLSFSAFAGGYHKHNIDYTTVYEVTENSYSIDNDTSKLMALSIASSHPFDYATNKIQASINTGYYDGENAVSFGIAKNFKDIDALIHSSYGNGGGKHAGTVGVTFRW